MHLPQVFPYTWRKAHEPRMSGQGQEVEMGQTSQTIREIERVIESCRDRYGDLNETGRLLAFDVRQSRVLAHIGNTEAADEYLASAANIASNYRAEQESLRKAGLVPLTMLATTRRRRRARAYA